MASAGSFAALVLFGVYIVGWEFLLDVKRYLVLFLPISGLAGAVAGFIRPVAWYCSLLIGAIAGVAGGIAILLLAMSSI
jgi:hypothetical protein